MTKKKTKDWLIIIISTFVIALILFVGGFLLHRIFAKYMPSYANNIIAVYAAVAGGICTMYGVIITILNDRELNLFNLQEQYRPEFFCPYTYDVLKADRIHLFKEGKHKVEITNRDYYFQNSDKTDFRIEEVIIGDTTYPANSYYVEKKKVFCLCLKSRKTPKEFVIVLRSLDDVFYKATVLPDEKKVTIIEGY